MIRSARAQPRKVLIVDDDADWRSFLRGALEELGYEADEASSGEDALRALGERAYRIMLLDLYMPGLGGEEVAQRIPSGGPQIVFCTGATAQDAGHALGGGAHYYLPKC
ncbi:MAG: response regulator, partial [Myxococcales bacterium]